MATPLTLAGVGSAALAQGITFLYSQAGELLARRRAHTDAAASEKSGPTQIATQVPAVFGGQVVTFTPDVAAIESHADQLLGLRSALASYIENLQLLDPTDPQLMTTVSELRATLETIFGYHLTFLGEERPTTGPPVVSSKVQVGSVQGIVTGIEILDGPTGADIQSDVSAQDVQSRGNVTGVRIGRHLPPEAPI